MTAIPSLPPPAYNCAHPRPVGDHLPRSGAEGWAALAESAPRQPQRQPLSGR
jgi:hypothetical protein